MTKDNLGFQLPNLDEIIEPNPLTLAPETLVIDAIARMNQPRKSDVSQDFKEAHSVSRSSYLLVLEQSRLAGVLTERDIVKLSATAIDLRQVTVGEVMTRNVITLKQSDFKSIYHVMSILRRHQIRHLPVIDEGEQLLGMISSEGICRALNPSNLLKMRSVMDVMNRQVLQASPDSSVLSLSQLMAQHRQSCVVIVEKLSPSVESSTHSDNSEQDEQYLASKIPIGIVTERDIVQFQILGLDLAKTPAQTIMSTPLVCMKPTDSLLSVQQQMKKLRVRRLVIAGESGELQGIIGFQDMLKVFDTTELYGVISTLKQELNQQTKHLTQEIQQRKTSETMLHKNQQLLKLFVRYAPVAIAMLDCEMRYLLVSDRWISDYRLEGRDIIGRTHYEVFPEIPQRWRQDHQDCLTGKVTFLSSEEDSFVRLDGSVDWLRWELRPWHDIDGNVGGLLMFSEVITERKLLEQKLFAEKELAQVTLKSIGDAVITTDASGKVQYVNPVAERLTGWSTAEATGRPSVEILQTIDRFTRKPIANPVDLVLQKNRIYEFDSDTLLISRDGSEYAVENSAAPIHDSQGKLIGVVIVFHDVTQSRNLAQELSWQATHDSLTGLYNRRKFEEEVNLAITDSQNNHTCHALCYLDLDRFKIVNDTCGHVAGDELLKQITKLLKQRIRGSDVFARLGGDEFGLLLNQCSTEIAHQIANQLRQLVQNFCFTWEDKIFRIGVSIGLVTIDSTTANLTNVLSTADAACYAAKEKGRNYVHLYHEKDTAVAQQRGERQWIEKLNRALEENLFCLYAQKIISIEEHRTQNHYEILLRLIDEPNRKSEKPPKIIAPGAFLPAAERYDLMPAIDRWVVTTFLASYEVYCQLRREQNKKPSTNLYTINLSGASINNREFGTFLQEQFACYAIPPETICFEITETVAISNLDNAVNLIKQLKKLGCSIALDDFGSGMSSLTYLKNLPVDYLKIDGSFVKNIARDRIDYATVECFNHISQIMNIKTIAEFVEDDVILRNLKQIGVNYAQGYGIERPQPLSFN
jgi:diguanylate cyclase (GGDEF)-like protein/PAS domain S-box-containing protein